jgi:hypothetical protein
MIVEIRSFILLRQNDFLSFQKRFSELVVTEEADKIRPLLEETKCLAYLTSSQ